MYIDIHYINEIINGGLSTRSSILTTGPSYVHENIRCTNIRYINQSYTYSLYKWKLRASLHTSAFWLLVRCIYEYIRIIYEYTLHKWKPRASPNASSSLLLVRCMYEYISTLYEYTLHKWKLRASPPILTIGALQAYVHTYVHTYAL